MKKFDQIRFLKNIKRKKKSDKRKIIDLILLLGIFIFFISSGFLFNSPYSDIKASEIGEVLDANSKSLTLASWGYSEKDEEMQIIIEINDLSISDSKEKWELKTSSKIEKIETIYKTSDLIVMKAKVKKNFREASIAIIQQDEISEKEDSKGYTKFKFYMNDKVIEKLDKVLTKDSKENDIKKVVSDSKEKAFKNKIKSLEKEIKKLQEKIDVADKKLKEAENSEEQSLSVLLNKRDSLLEKVRSKEDEVEKLYKKLRKLRSIS